MGAPKSPEKAARRRNWAAVPCLALARIRGRLHRLGGVKGRAGGGTDSARHVGFDVLLLPLHFDRRTDRETETDEITGEM
ncbi:hypothetical protein CMUS01_01511 [Colletotrichum musicola]|uniref:Uncharacterized protein n=1 Tax=Colletotrichum musicola TaxID=2175873 RepID=A0A8H6NWW5_9PEZI|nr:hypothetical protein CMUS01_01511 [Colletotrichum musicola]